MTTMWPITLIISISLATIWNCGAPCAAFRHWGKIALYLPDNATKLEKRIAELAADGNPTEALALADKAIKSEKDISRILLLRIQLNELLLQEDKLPADFRQLLTIPLEEKVLLHAIDLADRIEELEIGIKLGDRYLKEFGTHFPQPIVLTARMNSKLKQYSRAEQLLLLVVANPSMRDYSCPELARVYVSWKKPEKLIALTTTALNNPKCFTEKSTILLRNMRANAYLQTGKYKEALADYDKLVAIAPNLPEVYSLRAKTLTALGQSKLAEADRLKQEKIDAIEK